VLTPEIVVALIGLAVLALLPVVYRKLGARRAAALRPSPPVASTPRRVRTAAPGWVAF
jgi:hypothetical protein